MPLAQLHHPSGKTRPISFLTPEKIQNLDSWLKEIWPKMVELRDVMDRHGHPKNDWGWDVPEVTLASIRWYFVNRDGTEMMLFVDRKGGGIGK